MCGLIGGRCAGQHAATRAHQHSERGQVLRGILGGDGIPDLLIPHLIELKIQGGCPIGRLITFCPLEQINLAAED
jgi:aryl-alcohol dehydrogenase